MAMERMYENRGPGAKAPHAHRLSLTFPYRAPIMVQRAHMKQITIRFDLRISDEMNEFLVNEASSRKLSFEGLMLMYIEDQMKRVRQESQRIGPRKP